MFKDAAVLANKQELLDMCVSETIRRLGGTEVTLDEELLEEAAASSLDDARLGDALDLSKRASNCLQDIHTVGELLSYKASELLKISYLGHGTLNEIVLELGKHGLKLMDEKNSKTQAKIDKILLPSRRCLIAIEKLGLSASMYNLVKSFGYNTVNDLYWPLISVRLDGDTVAELCDCLSVQGFPPPLP